MLFSRDVCLKGWLTYDFHNKIQQRIKGFLAGGGGRGVILNIILKASRNNNNNNKYDMSKQPTKHLLKNSQILMIV